MHKKTVSLDCDMRLAQALATAVRAYADAAYPPGGSECAQVARAALMDAAAGFEGHREGPLVVRKRLLPQLKAAVRWYLSQERPLDVESPPGLETVLEFDAKRSR